MKGHSPVAGASKAARSRSRGVRSVRSNTAGMTSGSNRRRYSTTSSSLPVKCWYAVRFDTWAAAQSWSMPVRLMPWSRNSCCDALRMRSRAPLPPRRPWGAFSNSVMPPAYPRWVPPGVHSLRSGRPAGRLSTQFGVHNIRTVSHLHQFKGVIVGKLEGKVAVITGASTGMALAGAKLFVDEGAYVFITGRRQEALDEAVKLIGRNVTAVQRDAANLDDLDRLFDTVKREKGRIDVLYASAGTGEAVPLGEITEQHFDATFGLNTRGTLFTVQKALPLFNDGGSIFMTGSVASIKGFPGYSVYAASKVALRSFARTWLNEMKSRNFVG